MLLRLARSDEYDFCHVVTRRNMEAFVRRYWGEWSEGIFRENYDRASNWIVESEGKAVGYVRLLVGDSRAILEDLQIVPEFQGRGLGTWSIREIRALLKKEGCDRLRLRVFLENKARELYLRLGFVDVEPEGSAVWMELSL